MLEELNTIMIKKGNRNKMKKLRAFTMAEAVLVMTILGIIAAVQITVIKPAQFKDKGYQVLAKTIYGEIDTAIMQVLTDKAPYNKMDNIYNTSNTLFSTGTTGTEGSFVGVLKLYLATSRAGSNSTHCTTGSATVMHLKNGACLGVKSAVTTDTVTRIPGETGNTTAKGEYGMLYLDVNGADEPNVIGKDQYTIPLDINGIKGG